MPVLSKDKQYWICLKWATASTVDASNYVSWQYDNAGAYGQPRAVYDGSSWTVTSDQSHYFGLYSAELWTEEGSIIGLLKNNYTGTNPVGVFGFREMGSSYGNCLLIRTPTVYPYGYIFAWQVSSQIYGSSNYYIRQQFITLGSTFSKTASTGKVATYLNGRLVNTAGGSAGEALLPQSSPFMVGARLSSSYLLVEYFYGLIGAIIMTKNVLTESQMQKLHNYAMPYVSMVWGCS
jgi:hypothetical protein